MGKTLRLERDIVWQMLVRGVGIRVTAEVRLSRSIYNGIICTCWGESERPQRLVGKGEIMWRVEY